MDLQTVAEHFSYADRLKKLHEICSRVGVAAICPKIDKKYYTNPVNLVALIFNAAALESSGTLCGKVQRNKEKDSGQSPCDFIIRMAGNC